MSDIHQHYCRQCRRPWEHDGEAMENNAQIRAEHHCPVCGTPGWVKFYGNETHEEMCQMEALLETSEDDRLPDGVREQAEMDFARMAQRLHVRPERKPRPFVPYDLETRTASLEELLDQLFDS